MLIVPENNQPLKIIGIDPGTNGLGLSILEIEIACKEIHLKFVKTFYGNELSKSLNHFNDTQELKFLRLLAHQNNLIDYFNLVNPHFVICESPYLGLFPAAYGALVESVLIVKQALFIHDPFKVLQLIDPSTVKKNIGIEGRKNNNKDLVKEALKINTLIKNNLNIDYDSLDEHSIDSIAIGYSLAKSIIDLC